MTAPTHGKNDMLYVMSSSFQSKRGIGILEYCANVTAMVLSILILLILRQVNDLVSSPAQSVIEPVHQK